MEESDLESKAEEPMRIERDSLGEVKLPAKAYWGAQTQRSLHHFYAGGDRYRWPRSVVKAFGLVKRAAAFANHELGLLPAGIIDAMLKAADEVIAGQLDDHFPLKVFQTGSGTHSNMNANEVIANRAIELLGGERGSKTPVHPNDHVNCSQSSNDVFPTVMHLALVENLLTRLLPAMEELRQSLLKKSAQYAELVKSGRTHLQDAAPLTLGQEISAWCAQLEAAKAGLQAQGDGLMSLALGGTAVGTGLNAHPQFAARAIAELSRLTGLAWRQGENLFAGIAAHDAVVAVSAALRNLACALLKIANDVRWLASGPRCGIGELRLPQNEPGSSIMPGKVNPTQCEALAMVCVQVYGNDATVAFAGSQGNFQLNAYKPVMLDNCLQSMLLLSDAIEAFDRYCAAGLSANEEGIASHLQRNLMLVTALNPHIGYDNAAQVAKLAERENLPLEEACQRLGLASAEQFRAWVKPEKMLGREKATRKA